MDPNEQAVSAIAMAAALKHPRVANGHFLIHPAFTDRLADAIALEGKAVLAGKEANTRLRGAESGSYYGYKVDNGTAIIPVMGSLISRGAFVGSIYGVTSYEGLRSEIRRAAADPKVDKIALAIDSPGGAVSGIDAVGQEIAAAKQKKPVIGFVEGMGASAAYWIASQADAIVMTDMSEVGSIGVVTMHADISGMLKKAGVDISMIFSGEHKGDGNPFGPLPDSVRAEWQAEVDSLRGKFCQAVARGRKNKCSADTAMATEARMYTASDAISMGLADYTGSLDAVVAAPAAFWRAGFGLAAATVDQNMANLSEAVAAASPANPDPAPVPAAPVAADPAPVVAADPRERIKAILGHPEAVGRSALAQELALNTDLSVDQAAGVLKASAKETAPRAPSVADRTADMPTIAVSASDLNNKAAVAALWDKVAQKSNARRGFN